MSVFPLQEYGSVSVHKELVSYELREKLQRDYKKELNIELIPNKEGDQWKFTAKGWVGYIQVTENFALFIEPKVPIKNILAMLEYTPEFRGVTFLESLVSCDTLQDFLNRLADLLANQVLERSRKGLHRGYVQKNESLTHVRGRIDITKAIQKPWEIKMPCQYQENTLDIEDNQIITYTLHRILRSGLCEDKTQSNIRKAFRALHGCVTLRPFVASDCCNRQYSRLNRDYQNLHLLCQFFLSHAAPSHKQGDNSSFGFLVNMAKLYEDFVAAWLQKNLPLHLRLVKQYSIPIGLDCSIDLVIEDIQTGECKFVLDTKYKASETVDRNDFHQVRSYAEAMKCRDGILIYPKELTKSLDTHEQSIRLRSLTFALDDDLDRCGNQFLKQLNLM